MANFAVAASNDTIERANRIMDMYAQEGDKKEDVLNRIMDLAESESVRGTHPELEVALRAVDATICTLIKQINGVVAGQDAGINDLRDKLNRAIEEKQVALDQAQAKEEAAVEKEKKAVAAIQESQDLIEIEKEKYFSELKDIKKEMDQAVRERDDAREIAAEKTSSNNMLLKKMHEMEAEVESYHTLQADYNQIEGSYNELKLQMREKELMAEIEIEKAISQRERELRKEFESEIRKVDAENVRLQMELEQLKKQIEK